jgi:hypothetical protein
MKQKSTLFTLAVLTALSLSAHAATSIINLAASANNQAGFTSIAGITFSTGTLGPDNKLASIDLAGPTGGGAGASNTQTLLIYVDSDNDASTWGLSALVGTSTNSLVLTPNATRVIYTFDFSGQTLATNTVYAIVFGGADGIADDGAGDDPRFGLVNGNTISSTMFQNNGTSAFATSHEAAFTVNLVPEPSPVLLGGLGMLALLRRRRG